MTRELFNRNFLSNDSNRKDTISFAERGDLVGVKKIQEKTYSQ